MANTENIEAKLCAYIDGELDEQGRAEIEKHLAANPQHRGLIAQLSQQRQMLRALPRERAPEEIIETLQGQLERAGLLGDDDGSQADVAAMRISRWPQFMAAAAIVLLAIGLVGIIYFVLPRQGGTNDVFVIGGLSGDGSDELRTATTGQTGTADSTAGASTQPLLMDGFARRELEPGDASGELSELRESVDVSPEPTEPLAMKGGQPPAAPDSAAAVDAADPTEVAVAPAARPDAFEIRPGKGAAAQSTPEMGLAAEIRSAQERLFSADLTRQLQNKPGGVQQNAAVLFVCASDPAAANSEVTNYLVSNNIQWEPLPEGPPSPLQQSDLRDMHLLKQAPARLESKSMTFRQATESPDVTIEQTITLPPPATQQTQEDASLELQQAEAVQSRRGGQTQVAATNSSASTQPQDATSLLQQEQDQSLLLAANQATRQRLIIARNMTQKQAADLSESLRRQSYVQSASVYAAPSASDATAPTTQPEAPQTDLKQEAAAAPETFDDVERQKKMGRDPAREQEPAAADPAERVPAATSAPPAFEDALADRPASPPAQAQQESSYQPAESSVEVPEGGSSGSSTTVATADRGRELAEQSSTQPLPMTGEERLDVVIVLQDDEPVPTETAPFSGQEPPVMQQQAAPIPAQTQPAEPPAEPPVDQHPQEHQQEQHQQEQQQQQQQPAPEPAATETP